MSRFWTHFILDRRSSDYWRVTFNHPPINIITATTRELSELVDLIEGDAQLNVGVTAASAASSRTSSSSAATASPEPSATPARSAI